MSQNGAPTPNQPGLDDETMADAELSPNADQDLPNDKLPQPQSEPDASASAGDTALEAAETRIANKKDVTLREFLSKMDDYAPIIPDALTTHYLSLAGLPPPPATPLPLARLLALATQKFIADIAADAYQYARIRQGHSSAANAGLAAAAAAAAGPQPPLGQGGAGVGGAAGAAGATKGANLGAQRPGFGGGGAGVQGGAGAASGANQRTVLTMEDLGMAVGEYGVNIKRGEFYR